MEHFSINGHGFYNMLVNACNSLEGKKNFVNSLNVFPVPDGDTGTNMSMTFRSAVNEIKGMQDKGIGEIAKQLSKGALMGARGNSGVILSQILRGMAKSLEGLDEADSTEFANCILEGSKSAYKAVMRPTEGTILTVVRAAGEKAVSIKEKDIVKFLEEVCKCADEVLDKTPEMLPVLKKAKVVDSGGMGFTIILNGMYEAVKDNIETVLSDEVNEKVTNAAARNVGDIDIKYGYCTEFFIKSNVSDLDDFKLDLSKHGDSMIVVNDDDIIKVHIHSNDPGLILSKALKLGELSKIKIDNMREEHRHVLEDEYPFEETPNSKDENKEDLDSSSEHKKYGFISVAAGEGMIQIFKDFGTDFVIEGGQTMNPSTQDILSSINKLDAENIFIFPNNKNIIMAANQAAELADKNVIVVPTKTIPQGITCLTEFNNNADASANEKNMNEAIKKVATASVTYAVRDTEIDGTIVTKGDILGLVEGKIVKTGKDPYNMCEELLSKIVNDESELISIYYGNGIEKNDIDSLLKKLENKYDDLDIECSNGKQPLYYFIISAE
ncbi:MAG: DAK2 domain-containing protein [Clostridium sp.]|nr:DAK2 domain-containing protein [Clostridium sp.]